MNTDPKLSAQPCGCDPGLPWVCDYHKIYGLEVGRMASREAVVEETVQVFASGATRSADNHKYDYEGFLSPEVLHEYGRYMHQHRVQRDGSLRDSDNWQKGIPQEKYVKSLVRHVFDLWRLHRGYKVTDPDTNKPATKEDLACAIMFNAMGFLYTLVTSQSS
jgi:hypothetical protein